MDQRGANLDGNGWMIIDHEPDAVVSGYREHRKGEGPDRGRRGSLRTKLHKIGPALAEGSGQAQWITPGEIREIDEGVQAAVCKWLQGGRHTGKQPVRRSLRANRDARRQGVDR